MNIVQEHTQGMTNGKNLFGPAGVRELPGLVDAMRKGFLQLETLAGRHMLLEMQGTDTIVLQRQAHGCGHTAQALGDDV